MQNIPKGNKPFSTIHIDLMGILDSQVKSKKHVLFIIDAFTKLTKLCPTKSTMSAEAIACLKKYFANYRKPKIITSDRGTWFTSTEINDFLTEYEMRHVPVATGSPKVNGQLERVNRTLSPMLGTDFAYALNNSVHKSTGPLASCCLV